MVVSVSRADGTARWQSVQWQGEAAWASTAGSVQAVVSEARARLVYLGAADGSLNLLNAPSPQPPAGQNQGGHRFWLGPQYRWVWPPLKEWEFSAAAKVTARSDGTLVLEQPHHDTKYPALTREYAWLGSRLRCTVRWRSNGLPVFGLHVIPVNAPVQITARLLKWEEVPQGMVPARMVDVPAPLQLPDPAISLANDTATIRSGIKRLKLGFIPQILQIERAQGWKLAVGPGPYEGLAVGSADQGYLSQIWVGDAKDELAELEQLSPYLIGDASGLCASSIEVEAVPPSR